MKSVRRFRQLAAVILGGTPTAAWAQDLASSAGPEPSLSMSAVKALLMLMLLAALSYGAKRIVPRRWGRTSAASPSSACEITVQSRLRVSASVELVTIQIWDRSILLSVSPQGAASLAEHRESSLRDGTLRSTSSTSQEAA